MIHEILSSFFSIALVLFYLFIVYFILRTCQIYLKTRIRGRKATKRRRLKHFLYHFMYSRYFNTFDALKWLIYDFFSGKEKIKFFGIWAFTGYFGQGKTLGAVTLANFYKRKYAHKNIQIYTNFEMVGQAGKIESWEDMLDLPKWSLIIFDEMQSTFTSQKFKDFPIDLLWKLTQCRKNKLMVFASTPVFHRLAVQIRENVDYVVTCKNVFGWDRMFKYGFYKAPDYERSIDNPLKLIKNREFSITNIATNKEYRAYNTDQIVDRLDISQESTKKNSNKIKIIASNK